MVGHRCRREVAGLDSDRGDLQAEGNALHQLRVQNLQSTSRSEERRGRRWCLVWDMARTWPRRASRHGAALAGGPQPSREAQTCCHLQVMTVDDPRDSVT